MIRQTSIFGSQDGVLPNWTLPGCPTSNGRCHVTTSTRREVQYLTERTPPSIQSVATDSLQNKEKISEIQRVGPVFAVLRSKQTCDGTYPVVDHAGHSQHRFLVVSVVVCSSCPDLPPQPLPPPVTLPGKRFVV